MYGNGKFAVGVQRSVMIFKDLEEESNYISIMYSVPDSGGLVMEVFCEGLASLKYLSQDIFLNHLG